MKYLIFVGFFIVVAAVILIFNSIDGCDCSDCFSCLAKFNCKKADCLECSCSSECISYEECSLDCVSLISPECEICFLVEENWREKCSCEDYVKCLDNCNC